MRAFIKRIVLVCLISSSLFSVQHAQSQPNPADPLRHINEQLRAIFSPLARPNPSREFLYEMSAHLVDSAFFAPLVQHDTSNMDNWFMLYQEMLYAAYDTLPFEHRDSIWYRGMQWQKDTVPFLVMDYDMYRFIDTALTTDAYFHFDTVNDVLTDKAVRPGFPYENDHVFSVAPLGMAWNREKITFRFDPSFYFYDSFNFSQYEGGQWTFKVDFDDGNGWVTINPTVVVHHQVTYASTGGKIIKAAWFNGSTMTRFSQSKLTVTALMKAVPPAYMINGIPGVNVGVYPGCNSPGIPGQFGKVVLVLEGIDLLDWVPGANTTVEETFQHAMLNSELAELGNFGYDFLVVDWKNSRKDMRLNAQHVIDLIKWLRCQMVDDHQIVIVGISMGGVVARYALTKMEHDLPNGEECAWQKGHNTRLLISWDSPHAGANIPMSIQHLYKDGLRFFDNVVPFSSHIIANLFRKGLDDVAPQQLLRYHVDTHNPFVFSSSYGPHGDFFDFFGDLASIGNFPQHCKLYAIANGSIAGLRQTRPWDGAQRIPKDYLLDFDGDVHVRVIGIKFKVFGAGLELRSNGHGYFYKMHAGTWAIKVKVKLFGIKIKIGLNSLVDAEEAADNLQPLCIAPGGISTGIDPVPDWKTNFDAFLFRVKSENDGNGKFTFESQVGIPFLANAGADFSIYSDGLHFSFIPTFSALSYATSNIYENIMASSTASIMSKTPMDVITGMDNLMTNIGLDDAGNPEFSELFNLKHPFAEVVDRSGVSVLYPNQRLADQAWYPSCTGVSGIIPRLLAREIGDDQLFLENTNLNRPSRFEAQFNIQANVPNPYYDYPSQPNTAPVFGTTFSKENPFAITGAYGQATLKVNSNPPGIGLNYQPPYTGPYTLLNEPLDACCNNYSLIYSKKPEVNWSSPEPVESSMKLYPNPVVTGEDQVSITFGLDKAGHVTVLLHDAMGRIVHTFITTRQADPFGVDTIVLNLSEIGLNSGIYIVELLTPHKQHISKLIVQ